MTNQQTLEINGKLPGMNRIVDSAKTLKYQKGRKRVYVYTDDKRYYSDRIAQLCKLQRLKPVKTAILSVTFYEKAMRRDPDNIMAGCKFILDGLVRAGILPDDNVKHVRHLSCSFVPSAAADRITVTLTEAE